VSLASAKPNRLRVTAPEFESDYGRLLQGLVNRACCQASPGGSHMRHELEAQTLVATRGLPVNKHASIQITCQQNAGLKGEAFKEHQWDK
jgi:hypothetical protein